MARLVLVGDPVPISGTRISEGDMKTYFFDCKEEDLKWLEEQLTELCKKLSEFAETKVGLRVRRHHDRVEVSGDAGLIKALKDTKLPIGLMRRATTFKHRRQPESDAPQ